MRLRTKNRFFAALTAVCYTAAATVSAFFHHHASPSDDVGAGCCSAHAADHEICGCDSRETHRLAVRSLGGRVKAAVECPVCQFLSHKPSPARDIPTVRVATLVDRVAVARPAPVSIVVFAAWQSRAPPTSA